MTTIPFACETKWDFAAERRLAFTRAFVELEDIEGKTVANVGPVDDRMFEGVVWDGRPGRRVSVPMWRDDWNFGLEERGAADTIFCLEVLEHLMNPALVLRDLAVCVGVSLTRVLYLSTPIRNPLGMWCNEREHFTEYAPDKVATLLDYAGWRVTKHATFRTYPWPQSYLHGMGPIRGTVRILTQRTGLWRAVAK